MYCSVVSSSTCSMRLPAGYHDAGSSQRRPFTSASNLPILLGLITGVQLWCIPFLTGWLRKALHLIQFSVTRWPIFLLVYVLFSTEPAQCPCIVDSFITSLWARNFACIILFLRCVKASVSIVKRCSHCNELLLSFGIMTLRLLRLLWTSGREGN